jgi:hypothetical protein
MRSEVCIFRGGAGGIFLDVSSGSFRGSLRIGANWAEAPEGEIWRIKQVNQAAVKADEYLMGWLKRLKVGAEAVRDS